MTHSTTTATWIGFSAVGMWGVFPLLAAIAGTIPPFELTAIAFSIAFTLVMLVWKQRGESIRQHLRLPLRVWLLGVFGLFGFHFLYFTAFRNAPRVDALLIINLWPLLIVLLAIPLLGMQRRWQHLAGGICGFTGVVLITLGKGEIGFSPEYLPGYAAALGCAIIWSSYSVISRKWSAIIPKEAVGAYCGASALLSAACHFAWEETLIPSPLQWGIILLMGIGPMGGAFFTWDIGVRKGNIQLLGILSNMGVLIATGLLILFGYAPFSSVVVIAALLIASGAVLGSRAV